MRILIPFLALLLISGCATFMQSDDPVAEYEEYIIDWQEKIERDGWSERVVDDVVAGCVDVMSYHGDMEVYGVEEHWPTVKEMKAHGMRDDCDGFAVLMLSSLKRLGYPYAVRIQVIRTVFGTDHAMLRVKMPNGEWKRYNSTPVPGGQLDIAMSWPIFEWDEKRIYRDCHWWQSGVVDYDGR